MNSKNKNMEKILKIKGMSCSHCAMRVEKALNKIEGVVAKVDLKYANGKVGLVNTGF
ncbi:MAG: cation transporter [Paludibacteraceae bacterium]